MQGTDPNAPQGHLSPDGLWRWDGLRWVPVASLPPPPTTITYTQPGAVFGQAPAAAASTPPRSWLATSGGITAIIAVVVIIVACILPYAQYSSTVSSTTSPSVFNGGFPGAWGQVTEPALVIMFALAAAILVIASMNRTARAFSSGALVAMGAQTALMFVGYGAGAAGYGQVGSGSVVGFLGGVLLFVGGAISAGSLLSPTSPSTSSSAIPR